MKTIKAQQLSPEAFQKYGVYQNLLDKDDLAKKSLLPPFGFFPDIITLDFDSRSLPTVSVCHVTKTAKNIVSFLEAHQHTCEGLLPLDGDVIIFVGAAFGEPRTFSVDMLEAFIVPKGTFVKLNSMVLHGTQFPVSDPEVHILCMLPARTFKNDMLANMIADEDKRAEIVL
jgi:ureidoglycolate lyase